MKNSNFKAGYVALVGLPNAGKSSLINALVGHKVAIISSKPQTTRDNILGILTGEDFQIVFVDTPGVHRSKNSLDKIMNKQVRSAVGGVDLVLYLLDGTKEPSQDDIVYIKHLSIPTKIIRTKLDLKGQKTFDADLSVSALTRENLDKLIDLIKENLPNYNFKNYLFNPDYYTDKSVKFLICEQIRENALNMLREEVPHGIATQVVRFDEFDDIVHIDIDLICEEDRHKGMIIGKGGQILKKIGQSGRIYAEELLNKKVMLKLFVRVEKDWRNKPQKLKNLGY